MMQYSNTPVRTVMDRVAKSAGFTVEQVLARSRRPDLDRVRSDMYVALRDGKDMSFGQIANVCDRKRHTVYAAYNRRKSTGVRQPSERYYYEELNAQVRRLIGQDLIYQVVDRLGVPVGQAAFLTILGESYPTVLSRENFIERYEMAMERILNKTDARTDRKTMNKQLQLLRKRMAAQGLPDPVTLIIPGAMRLSHEIAPWLHHQFGTPIYYREAEANTG